MLHKSSLDKQALVFQIQKVISQHFPKLIERLDKMSDPRKRKSYKISELLLAAIMMHIFKEGSRNAFNQDRKEANFRKNYRRIFGLNLPHMDTVNAVLGQLDSSELEGLKRALIGQLLIRRVLHKFRLFKKYFCVAVDATGYASFEKAPYEGCPYRVSKKGKTTYLQPILEAKIVCPNGFSISIATEWVLNGAVYKKQDCELKAFKRLSVKLKKYFKRLPICILADGLYPNKSVFDICRDNGWGFIITLKDKSLKDVWEEVAAFGQLYSKNTLVHEKVVNKTQSITRQYRWINGIEYKGHQLNWVECIETKRNVETGKEEQTRFVHITCFEINAGNCADISKHGRLRWKVENEGFNVQKNGGYKLKHKYARKNLQAIQNYYQCMQIAHMINQLIELSRRFKELKAKNTIKHLWKVMIAFMFYGECTPDMIDYKKTKFRYT